MTKMITLEEEVGNAKTGVDFNTYRTLAVPGREWWRWRSLDSATDWGRPDTAKAAPAQR